MNIKIAPSLLACDFAELGSQVKEISALGVDFLHIDIMDGHFVPNISIGPMIVKAIRPLTKLPLDAHLMISQPLKYIEQFVEAGADIITLHIETIDEAGFIQAAKALHQKGLKIAVALNPQTQANQIKAVASFYDMVLVMTVNPGFGGQKFMEEVVPKISQIRNFFKGDIAVDGGIDDQTAPLVIDAGANILAAGTYIFKAKNKAEAIEKLRQINK